MDLLDVIKFVLKKMKQQSLLLPFEYLFAEKFLVKFLVLIFWLSFKY